MQLPLDDKVIADCFHNSYSKRLFCPYCGQESIFRFSDNNLMKAKLAINAYHSSVRELELNHVIIKSNKGVRENFKELIFECSASPVSHRLYFYFVINDKYIIKSGQYPSVATIKFTSKYNSLLKEYVKEYKKSIGLYSHGIGIGSFVYLRRIFEFIIEEVHKQVKSKEGWSEDEYQKSHIDDKIKKCEKFYARSIFPEELNPYRMRIYGVLSKGIHQLDEQECLTLFPSLQFIIERILDYELEKKTLNEKLKDTLKKLPSI
jgi:hypothetical protein